jgi:hypothetical protein
MAKAELLIQCSKDKSLVKIGTYVEMSDRLMKGETIVINENGIKTQIVDVENKLIRYGEDPRKYILAPILTQSKSEFAIVVHMCEEEGFIF